MQTRNIPIPVSPLAAVDSTATKCLHYVPRSSLLTGSSVCVLIVCIPCHQDVTGKGAEKLWWQCLSELIVLGLVYLSIVCKIVRNKLPHHSSVFLSQHSYGPPPTQLRGFWNPEKCPTLCHRWSRSFLPYTLTVDLVHHQSPGYIINVPLTNKC